MMTGVSPVRQSTHTGALIENPKKVFKFPASANEVRDEEYPMTTVIMSLYENRESLLEVRERLLEGGFDPAQVKSLHRGPLYEEGLRCEETPDEEPETVSLHEARQILTSYEFEPWEAEDALRKIRGGEHLLLVRSGDELAGRGVDILNEEPGAEHRREDSY